MLDENIRSVRKSHALHFCNKCHKPNHFAVKCRQKSQLASIRQVEGEDDTSALAHDPDDSQLINTKIGEWKLHAVSGSSVQCDTRIQKSRKRPASQKDHENHSQDCCIWWFNLPVVGKIILNVRRGKTKHRIDCKLVEGNQMRPLLACISMNVVKYLDNDSMNKPITDGAPVYALSTGKQPVTQAELIEQYPQVFKEGIGCLEGEHHIRIDPQHTPVQHPPRKVPVALRDRLKSTLEDLEKQDVPYSV